jgi:hypothetical protein
MTSPTIRLAPTCALCAALFIATTLLVLTPLWWTCTLGMLLASATCGTAVWTLQQDARHTVLGDNVLFYATVSAMVA